METDVRLTPPAVGNEDARLTPQPTGRPRARSHKEYLDTLIRPTSAEVRRISDAQLRKEEEIDRKYHQHTAEEQDAARLIQRAYRGHRERRQLNGLTLDPSSRWVEVIREWRYRSATAPHYSGTVTPQKPSLQRDRSDTAKLHWRRAKEIAEHAGAGESTTSLGVQSPVESTSSSRSRQRSGSKPHEENVPNSMLLDLRYFLEMVDTKHRYGTNLAVYHEQWQREKTSQNFFYWLDYGDGKDVDLAMCSREKLEKERIRYLSKEERKDYLVEVDDNGLLRWAKNGELITTSSEQYQDSIHGIVPAGSNEPRFNDEEVQRQRSEDASFTQKLATVGGMFKDAIKSSEPRDDTTPSSSSSSSSASSLSDQGEVAVAQHTAHEMADASTVPQTKPSKKSKKKLHVSPATILNHLLRASVRPGTWIYVSDTVGRLYIGIKSSGAFQHASFLSGARISSAGIIGVTNGKLTYLSPLSGHYRPTTKSFKRFIENLKAQGVDTSDLKVSSAYKVLLGMEYYGTTKKGMKAILHPEREHKRSKAKQEIVKKNELLHPVTLPAATATEQVEHNWKRRKEVQEREHRGLGKLMDDLNMRRKSQDGR
ncbi:IQ domain-containing protein IQM1 [Pseudocercospora fuligena]|uniref:IQ domain-containing protein IQM1 n=1 Tax=Pseudocercospora fuligena TaxID=685502 RepID=A0A8H6RF03_9PEZI|nr:IQ domain-containing protein IQM1 [Pseudocercospora fuligena]